jgi:hypothetical protein
MSGAGVRCIGRDRVFQFASVQQHRRSSETARPCGVVDVEMGVHEAVARPHAMPGCVLDVFS